MPPSTAPPLALGINCGHDASVAVCSPAGILCAIQEERITRIKHYYGFPRQALELALTTCGLTPRDVTLVAFPSRSLLFPEQRTSFVVEADGRRYSRETARARHGWRGWARHRLIDPLGLLGAERWARLALLSTTHRYLWDGYVERDHGWFSGYLRDLGLISDRVAHYYVAHHLAHAASAARLSGLDHACVITLDGSGDGLSGTIYAWRAGQGLELVRSSRASDSLGAFYQAATEALGFIPVDGEHKTMGLAAHGNADSAPNPYAGDVRVDDGVLRSSVAWSYRRFNRRHPERRVPNPLSSVAQSDRFRAALDGMEPTQLASFVQRACEDVMVAYARDAVRLTGESQIAAAGGVMLNVKGNAAIRDALRPPEFFVFPDAADSGLAAGAALEALAQTGALAASARVTTPYLGHEFDDAAIERALAEYRTRHQIRARRATATDIAARLAGGWVIGTFRGRLEMGPRALGNRSVLADPRRAETKDRINRLLKGREWFVPFAPAVLEDDARLYWDGPTDYRYMTFATRATPYARRAVPAVVHVDGTMRPQVVSRDTHAWLHQLLVEFKRRTGIGVLLNTSFNRHGLPIVGAPTDALEHLVNGWVDGLALGSWFVDRGDGAPGAPVDPLAG